jgi:hypothetical protein
MAVERFTPKVVADLFGTMRPEEQRHFESNST